MIVSSRVSRATGVAERWKQQYYRRATKEWDYKGEAMYDKLVALGSSPTPEQVNATIGNDSWTQVTCHECGDEDVDVVVQLGDAHPEIRRTACVCIPCLRTALEAATDRRVLLVDMGEVQP